MKHFILGTAGHVDHGKTALIKGLTGIECDTHKEEKARGITINLGFAHLDLPSGVSFGIVDVPGHRDFVHTMVGGATGIDLALLVVAADSGVMPQTLEHLQIMNALGIRSGLVAITKIDLADPDIVDLAEEEIRELLNGTFLEDCPIVRVSPVTGDGMDVLKESLDRAASSIEPRKRGEVFRLFPDRIFTVSGFGTVVTGSVLGGILNTGDTAYLLPGEKKLRIRRLERHGSEVEQVVAGDRASLNLVGINRDDFQRGMVVSDRVLADTKLVDAKLHFFDHTDSGFELWTQVIFHLGTYEHQAKVHLIDCNRLAGGETGLAQIHLDSPCIVQHGDRFVIRSTSSDLTLGGGEIIDPSPLHHRRRTDRVVEGMERLAQGKMPELVASEIRKQFRPLSHREIAKILNVSAEEIRAVVSEGLPDNIASYTTKDGTFLLTSQEHKRLLEKTTEILTAHHLKHRLDEKGRTAEEMAGMLGIKRGSSGEAVFRLVLEELGAAQKIRRVGNTFVLFDHAVNITPSDEQHIEFVGVFLLGSGMSTPLIADLYDKATREGIDESDVKQILRYLVDNGKVYFIDGEYLHGSHVDRSRELLVNALVNKPDGLTVAQFRDLVSGNRKICLLLYKIFDSEGIISRKDDVRILTKKGEAFQVKM
ncbi:MAG: selenocysteine-specific translation elongation factor [Proteobacteria bacterium]|nr:selenocysteine-specific translation elongation factor [Pseudomonadota bacterium]